MLLTILAAVLALSAHAEHDSLGPLDVVSLAFSPSCVTPLAIRRLNEHLQVRRIHVVTQSDEKCQRFVTQGTNIQCHTEDQLVSGLTLHHVRDYLSSRFDDSGSVKTAQDRAGWYFQQLLKLGAASVLDGLSQYFLIWDLDMIPLRSFPLTFPSPSSSTIATRADISRVRISEYAHAYQHIFSRDVEYPKAEHSFVAHWMLVYQPYLTEMLEDIEHRTGKLWPWALLDGVQPGYRNVYYGLSEYTTYVSWVLQNKPGAIEVMPEKQWNRMAPRKHEWLAAHGFTDCCPSEAVLEAATAEGWAYLGWELSAFHAEGCSRELNVGG